MAIVTNGLIAYYNSLQGVSGTTWSNLASTGTKYDATLFTGYQVTASGMNFWNNSSGGGAVVSKFTELATAGTPFTIEFRANQAQITNLPNFYIGTTDNTSEANTDSLASGANLNGFSQDFSTVLYQNDAGNQYVWNSVLQINQDQYFSVVYDGGTNLTLYLNGASQGVVTVASNSTLINSADTYFGITDVNYTVNGVIDNFRVYNRALSSSEITQNYQNGTAVGMGGGGTPPPSYTEDLPVLNSIYPDDQFSFTSSTVTFSGTITDSDGDNIQLSVDYSQSSTFATGVTTVTSPMMSSGSNASAVTGTLTSGAWYWRARGIDSKGNKSTLSATRVFYITSQTSETLKPNAIVTSTNTSSAVSTIQDNPSSPDTTFMTPTTSGTSMMVEVNFPLPANNLVTGSGLQTFNVYAKRDNTNGTPSYTIALYDNGTQLAISGSNSVSSTTGSVTSYTWDAGLLSNVNGSTVQCRVTTTAYSSGSKKTNVDIGYISWVTTEISSVATVATPAADTTPPANVLNVQDTVTTTTANLTWSNPSDTDFSYCRIYRNGSEVGVSSNGSFADSALTQNTTYSYKITSVDTTGNESTGTTINVVTQTSTDTTPPANVTNLTASNTSSIGTTLIWTNPPDNDFDHANVYRGGTLLGNSKNGSYSDQTLAPSNSYSYKVTSVDTSGNESNGSSLIVTTPQNVAPAVPTNLFPFNGSAWQTMVFKATITDLDSVNLTFQVDYSTTDSTLATYTTVSVSVTLPSVGSSVTASVSPSGTFTANSWIYWRAYVSDNSGNTSAKTPIFSFEYVPTGGNFSTATTWMQQGSSSDITVVDVSEYNSPIDFVAMKNSGINYVLLRAYGADHSGNGDTSFETYVSASRNAGIKTGAYFYAMPSSPTLDLNQAHTEADLFINKLQAGYGTGQYGDLMPVIDLEDNTGHTPTGQGTTLQMTVSDLLTWTNEFRNYFQQKTGRILGLYTSDDFISDLRSNFNYDNTTDGPVSGTQGNIIVDMPLWIAGYTNYARYQGGVMPESGGWTKWQLFQHTSTATVAGVGTNGTAVDESWSEAIEWWAPPNTPTGLSATDDGINLFLTWNKTSEVDVHKWEIYLDGVLKGTTTTDGSYTVTGATINANHTIEVRPIDDFGDKPVNPASIDYTLGTVTLNPPNVTIVSVSRTKISYEPGDNTADVTFNFDKDIKAYTVNVNGTSNGSGTVVKSGGGSAQTVAQLQSETVSTVATETVGQLNQANIPAGTNITVTVDNTEMYQEGSNRVNIYGQSAADNSWTTYGS